MNQVGAVLSTRTPPDFPPINLASELPVSKLERPLTSRKAVDLALSLVVEVVIRRPNPLLTTGVSEYKAGYENKTTYHILEHAGGTRSDVKAEISGVAAAVRSARGVAALSDLNVGAHGTTCTFDTSVTSRVEKKEKKGLTETEVRVPEPCVASSRGGHIPLHHDSSAGPSNSREQHVADLDGSRLAGTSYLDDDLGGGFRGEGQSGGEDHGEELSDDRLQTTRSD